MSLETLAAHEADFDTLRHRIECELRACPEGLGEYELLKRLQAGGLLQVERFDDSLTLFRIHFSLFHALYTLRDQILGQSGEILSISPLLIRLEAGRPPRAQELDEHDALRAYYLDLSHLLDTGRDEVDSMLNDFWKRLGRRETSQNGRAKALEALGLKDPVDRATIKRRYRSLVMQHHPDRGGDTAVFQAINQAWRSLA